MKLKRKQTVGNIQFIVESNFKSGEASAAKDVLAKIMINKANEALSKLKKTIPQN